MPHRYARTLVRSESRLADDLRGLLDFSRWNQVGRMAGRIGRGSDPCALDIHFREHEEVMLYHGTTRLLTIRLSPRENRPDQPRVRFDADKAYQEGVRGNLFCREGWKPTDPRLLAVVMDYLSGKIDENAKIRPMYYADEQHERCLEGFWQNRLSIRYGQRWRPGDPFLVIDREAVIGHDESAAAKRAWLEGFWRPYREQILALQRESPGTWGSPKPSMGFPEELDLLAIGPGGDLVCVELKHGTNPKGIYFGPFQVSMYRDAFARALRDDPDGFSDSLKELVRQKVRLRLLPKPAEALLPQGPFDSTRVRAILAVAEPRRKSACWGRMSVTLGACRDPVDVITFNGYDCTWGFRHPVGGTCPDNCLALDPWRPGDPPPGR